MRAALLLLVALVAVGGVARAAATPPNIIVVLTDDQGFGDLSSNCENSTSMCPRTPNMDALVKSPHSAYFHRFYAAAGVCSPTRAAALTGRTNERDCIHFALGCDQEDPAPGCAQGKQGALPHNEFTIAKAAKKSSMGDYQTIQLGKWHLGDLWDKQIKGLNTKWPVSSPGDAGFDQWVTTEAEASSSMSNCGCFPVHHDNPGPKPPSGYPKITPTGDHCVVGGGYESDWAYPCTDYYYPNASNARNVTALAESYKVPGDDSEFLIDRFESFLGDRKEDGKPFLAHLCMHSIHEPHPAMPEYNHMYQNDPDYLGTLTQLDIQIGRLMNLLETSGAANNTVLFFTSDNGPHQGQERTDIHWSTNFLRQCKASIFEGGIRVPGMMYWPGGIKSNLNITTPVTTSDILPTVMQLLDVESDNPDWVIDGTSLVPIVQSGNPNAPRSKPLVFSWGNQQGVIDNDWKIITKPVVGQCDQQPGFNYSSAGANELFLYNLAEDYNELHDLKASEPAQFARMSQLFNEMLASIANSQVNETGCAKGAPARPLPGPTGPVVASNECSFDANTGLNGTDFASMKVQTQEECCGVCLGTPGCVASDFNGGVCHLKALFEPKGRNDGSVACVPI